MSNLTVRLFGGVHLLRPDHSEITLQPSVQIFLAYLLLNRERFHCRELLSTQFWGDRDDNHARRCLNTTLWRLRQELEPEGTPRGTFVQTTPGGEIGLNFHGDIWLDVAVFEEKVRGGLVYSPDAVEPAIAHQLEEAVELYVGDLLEASYDDWVLAQRERLRGLYTKCLIWLMHYHRIRCAYESSIWYGRKVVEMDPLREEIHRELMELYELNGERSQALRQYDNCRETLARELATEPLPEIQLLYRQLLAVPTAAPDGSQRFAAVDQPDSLTLALGQLDRTLLSLHDIREQLQQVLQSGGHSANR